ncbi:hypothetical protein [Ruegeria jejuensis]|uniref:hypothetical protein n=1 Tax=Ruegeria jejuensis TaxID=3233338 RepID=UPI00355C2D53
MNKDFELADFSFGLWSLVAGIACLAAFALGLMPEDFHLCLPFLFWGFGSSVIGVVSLVFAIFVPDSSEEVEPRETGSGPENPDHQGGIV